MIFSNRVNKENVNITGNGNTISRVTSYRIPGVMIDETMKSDVRINKVCTEVSLSIGVVRQVSNMLSDNALLSF